MHDSVHEQEVIAFHESGHAVVHHYFGHKLGSVAIGENSGHCALAATWTQRASDSEIAVLMKREFLFQNIMACMAGKCTIDRFYGYKAKSDESWRASDDYKQAFKCALRLNQGDSEGAELLMSWLERRTELLVQKHWPQVQALAFALLEHDQLDGEQVKRIIARMMRERLLEPAIISTA